MNRRNAARIAAPAVFLAGFTIAVLLVRAGLSDDTAARATTATNATATTRTAATTTRRTTTRARPTPRPVYATVEAGDTLDQIALEHDTTVARLLQLNPDLDPASLQIGQRVRVR